MMLAVEADGHEVLTIEGLPADDPVVKAFAEQCEPGYGTAMQCGYCTPGFVMTAKVSSTRTRIPPWTRSKRRWPATFAVAAATRPSPRPVLAAARR